MRDLKGKKISRLLVVRDTGKRSSNGFIVWLCRCDCGNFAEVRADCLKKGSTRSCGCLRKEIAKENMRKLGINRYKHGDSKIRIYRIWCHILSRCLNPKHKKYRYYGGRGIKVCPEWRNDYLAFKHWALANGYKENLTIDRINNDGNYGPNNCQWLTKSDNSRKGHSTIFLS